MTKILVANFTLSPNQRVSIAYNFNLDYQVSINELTIYADGNPFKFNFRIIGSSYWFANDLVRSDAIFWGVLPFRFPKPLILYSRQGIEVEYQEFTGTNISGQIIFIGQII